MISAFTTGLSGIFGALSWKAAGICLALGAGAALWLWVSGLRADLAELAGDRARLQHEAAVHRALLAQRDRALEALAQAEQSAAQRRKAAFAAREEAMHAPDQEDGPLAPVLRRALERLR